METATNTAQLNQLHQAMYDSVFDYVWFPIEVFIENLCPDVKLDYSEKDYSMVEQIDAICFEYDEYCGVREIDGKYQVNFAIFQLGELIGLDTVIEHMIMDEKEEED
ncbi:MAG: hypothetical protein FWC10_00790 [Lentimicrobiaceae bacterium]|nr:hypothetical protein [Lentimicrobiaceae bacterium]